MPSYRVRIADETVGRAFADFAAVMLTGPRASGKTTTALQHVANVIHLDREAEASAFRADPDAALRAQQEPVLLDEWQAVPEILGAIKRAVDADSRPGRFLLTGSVRADLDEQTWPGTGRVIRVPVWPLTRREIGGDVASPALLSTVLAEGVESVRDPRDPPDLPGYLELAVIGGFPEPALSATGRVGWHESYLDYLVTRDAPQMAGRRDPVRLRRYLDVVAECTAGLPADATLLAASGINAKTAAAYDRLLAALGILDIAPAWTTNRVKRLMLRGKRYLTDTGLAASALKADAGDLLRDGDLHGRILDTFVAAQVRPELAAQTRAPTLCHLRDKDGRHEIDQLVDAGRGGVIAIEVKSSAAPRVADAVHLAWLRDHLGPAFRAGILFHTGPRVFSFGDRLAAVPIACLWS